MFLAGATETLLSTNTLADPFALARISEAVSRSVTLDAGWDVLGFARQMQGLSAGAVTFRTIPTGSAELSTSSDGTAVEVDPDEVRAFVGIAIAADAGNPAAQAAFAPPVTAGVSDASVSAGLDRLLLGGRRVVLGRRVLGVLGVLGATPTSSEDSSTSSARPAMPVSPTPPITAAAPGCIN